MPTLIPTPEIIQAAGSPSKRIEEYIGRVASSDTSISIARMISPPGWKEPGQRPEFAEYTVVVRGVLMVETKSKQFEVRSGQALITFPGEWVRYNTPYGAEYIAVCLPAFSPDTVHRD